MSKIIFLDVDGTLINYETKTPPSAKIAVDKARANGHRVYICTGCSKFEVLQRDLPELDGMIGGNGCYVEDNGQVIMHQCLPIEDIKAIMDWCNKKGRGFYEECNSGIYCNEIFPEQGYEAIIKYSLGKGADIEAAKKGSKEFTEEMSLVKGDDLLRTDVNKMDFVLGDYQEYLDAKEYFKHLNVNTWGGKGEEALFCDFSPKNITKANAVNVLLKHLNAERKDTISFGDAKIDLSMFEQCAYNVAMGNGGPEIKEAADYITDDVDNDGLYKAFEKLGLI